MHKYLIYAAYGWLTHAALRWAGAGIVAIETIALFETQACVVSDGRDARRRGRTSAA
jgi:hypothetical protein